MNKSWVLGFIEGSGCFSVVIRKSNNQIGYQTIADFTLKVPRHQRDLLEQLHAVLKVGNIYENNGELALKISKLDDAKQLIRFLGNAFVSESKQREFRIWKHCVQLIDQGMHHTKDGILEIARLRDSVHTKKLWNKKTYCNLRAEMDPCHVYKETQATPHNCRECWDHESLIHLPAKEVAR